MPPGGHICGEMLCGGHPERGRRKCYPGFRRLLCSHSHCLAALAQGWGTGKMTHLILPPLLSSCPHGLHQAVARVIRVTREQNMGRGDKPFRKTRKLKFTLVCSLRVLVPSDHLFLQRVTPTTEQAVFSATLSHCHPNSCLYLVSSYYVPDTYPYCLAK